MFYGFFLSFPSFFLLCLSIYIKYGFDKYGFEFKGSKITHTHFGDTNCRSLEGIPSVICSSSL